MRFTAFVNREAAAADGGPWGELLPAVTVPVQRPPPRAVGPGRASAAARAGGARGDGRRAQPREHRARVGRFRRVVTVHDLIYARFPEAHSGIRDRGMRVLVPLGVRRCAAGNRRLAEHTRRPGRAAGARARAHRRRTAGPGRRAARAAARRGADTRALRPRRAARDPQPVGQAPAQEPDGADRCAGTHPTRGAPPAGAAGLPHLARGASCASAPRRWGSRRTCASRAGCERRARGPVGAGGRVRLPVAVRGLRVARAGGDGARGARRLRRRLLAARGCGRGGAAVRSARGGRDRGSTPSACSETVCCAEDLRAKGRERARLFTWERTAHLALESYARSLGLSGRRHRGWLASRRSCRAPSQRALQRKPPGVLTQTNAPCSHAAPSRRMHAHDRAAIACGSAETATNPLRPSWTSSTAALSGPATTTLGRRVGGGLDDDHAIALATEVESMHSARASAVSSSSAATKPGRCDDLPDAVLGDGAPRAARSGPSP